LIVLLNKLVPHMLYLPFSSAKYGRRPRHARDWVLPPALNQPLSRQRGIWHYARALFNF